METRAAAVGDQRLPGRASPAALFADPGVRYFAGVIALAALYRGAAEVGYALQFAGPVGAIVWLPVGIGVAFLYLGGWRYWPGVLIGDLLANDYGALPLGSALGQTAGNVLEVLVITILLRALAPRSGPLGSVKGLGIMLAAIVAGTTVSATIGSLSLLAGDVIDSDGVTRIWRTWWLGDASGALVVLPLALTWAHPPSRSWWRRRGVEMALMLIALVALSEVALQTSRPLSYVVFPALIWAALRLGRHGTTLAVAVAAGFAVWETTRQVGPFAYESVTYSELSTQLYIAIATISSLCLAVVVAEREAVTRRLASSRRRLVRAADHERRRIEQNLHDGAQQRLTALVAQLRMFEDRAREYPEAAAGMFDDASQELILAIDELRELAHGIQPSVLSDRGLADALRSMAMRSTMRIRLVELPDVRLDPTIESSAYFVASEAIANARKHARVDAVTVRVAVTHGELRMEVADDGAGGAVAKPGSGLEGLGDRVEAVGGTLDILSPPRGGTRILATMPARPA